MLQEIRTKKGRGFTDNQRIVIKLDSSEEALVHKRVSQLMYTELEGIQYYKKKIVVSVSSRNYN
jgi:hypothetical protein